jgi:hypothetical protein
MKEDFYKDIATKAFDLIKVIGEKLGVASDHIYSVLIKQKIIEGAAGIGSSIFFGIFIFFGIKFLIKFSKIAFSDPDIELGKFGCILFGIVLIILSGILGHAFFFSIPKIINPEYAAINEIISTIKN